MPVRVCFNLDLELLGDTYSVMKQEDNTDAQAKVDGPFYSVLGGPKAGRGIFTVQCVQYGSKS